MSWSIENICSNMKTQKYSIWELQGGFDPSKKSGVGVDFELIVRSLLLENKAKTRKLNMIFR